MTIILKKEEVDQVKEICIKCIQAIKDSELLSNISQAISTKEEELANMELDAILDLLKKIAPKELLEMLSYITIQEMGNGDFLIEVNPEYIEDYSDIIIEAISTLCNVIGKSLPYIFLFSARAKAFKERWKPNQEKIEEIMLRTK